ncbi:response regulator [bacterium]|nr:response regulator [bacterium]MBU1990878.1 response regulator [bacterium]
MNKLLPSLTKTQDVFIASKDKIILDWVSYSAPKIILSEHKIEPEKFIRDYAGGVFDYFMGVISGDVEIGSCPVMQSLLAYLKDREISADELFELCSHFRRSMIDFTYDANINSKESFDEISYIFDKNFKGILKFYTDTLFQRLIDARHEALQASQAKEYFLSNMSHEIRTPLNAVLGFVNLLIEEDISKKHRNYLGIILNSGENLLSIINAILDFSKLRSGEFTIEPKIFTLHDEISHTMELFVASANTKNITITSFIDPRIPKELFADALRIKQILSNLISNAIKFTPAGGVIAVEAKCKDKVLNISITDTGIGISDNDIKKIFSAFAQAQESELNKSDGTGLGLSICQQLAEHMGGSVNVESSIGKGSKFWLEIPIEVHSVECQMLEDIEEFKSLKIVLYSKNKDKAFQHDSLLKYSKIFGMDIEIVDSLDIHYDIAIFVHENVDNQFIEAISNSDKKYIALMSKLYDRYEKQNHILPMCFPLYCSKIKTTFLELLYPHNNSPHLHKVNKQFEGHILVAEDNEPNQELIKIILSKYGLTFDLAKNGEEACRLYEKNIYDLILMDEQMPVMDGNEAVQRILEYEKENNLEHTPVSALTANVIKGARERGLSSGFDSFLGKPIILKELERVFENYLKEGTFEPVVQNKSNPQSRTVNGLDAKKLCLELMLNEEELLMLLTLFIKKAANNLVELEDAITKKEYKKIALIAHSIKGSSGNFRIKVLQESASEMENMAKNENTQYDYEGMFEKIKHRVQEISIS